MTASLSLLFSYDKDKQIFYYSLLCIGFQPVNAQGVINILNLNYNNSFILYSSMTKLSNDMHYN